MAAEMEQTNECVLHDALCLLADARDIVTVCEVAFSFLASQVGAAAVSISIDARFGGGFRVHAAPEVRRSATAAEKHAHVLACLRRGQAIEAADVHDAEHGWLLGEGWRASRHALCIPLVVRGASFGFLSLHTDDDPSVLDSHLSVIRKFVSFLGVIIDRTWNLEELSEMKVVWENTLDSIADLVVLTDGCGNLSWINQAAAHHLFGGAGGWFGRDVSEIPLLRPLAGLYEKGAAGQEQSTKIASDLPDPANSRQRYCAKSRRVVSPETGRTRFVHVLRPGNFLHEPSAPVVARENKPGAASGGRSSASGAAVRTYSILLIDDEAMLARALSRGLAAIGHRVTSYGSGRGVLNEDAAVVHEAALAIVDMRLPDMEGIELAALLQARNPRLRFILTSGLEIAPELLDTIEAPCIFLHKPFRLDALLRAMDEVMA